MESTKVLNQCVTYIRHLKVISTYNISKRLGSDVMVQLRIFSLSNKSNKVFYEPWTDERIIASFVSNYIFMRMSTWVLELSHKMKMSYRGFDWLLCTGLTNTCFNSTIVDCLPKFHNHHCQLRRKLDNFPLQVTLKTDFLCYISIVNLRSRRTVLKS